MERNLKEDFFKQFYFFRDMSEEEIDEYLGQVDDEIDD